MTAEETVIITTKDNSLFIIVVKCLTMMYPI